MEMSKKNKNYVTGGQLDNWTTGQVDNNLNNLHEIYFTASADLERSISKYFRDVARDSIENKIAKAERQYEDNPPLALKEIILTRIIKLKIKKLKRDHGY